MLEDRSSYKMLYILGNLNAINCYTSVTIKALCKESSLSDTKVRLVIKTLLSLKLVQYGTRVNGASSYFITQKGVKILNEYKNGRKILNEQK